MNQTIYWKGGARLEHELLRQIVDTIVLTSNNNITIADQNGKIIHTNPHHWSVYGIEPHQLFGKTVYDLEKEGILCPSITAFVLKEKKPIEVMQHTNTGKVVMATGYPIFNECGEVIFVISYAQDQTEINNLQHQYEQLEKKVKNYQIEVEELRGKDVILYRSKKMEQLIKTINRVANSDVTVLLSGESGVGKSMLARKIHEQSDRNNESFIEVNCSTIPESLFESEMFGYEPGAFTGAHKKGKEGLIKEAHKGTLFLDEIGDLTLSNQVKLLKVLQEKKAKKIGANNEYHVDFRLITATNRCLEEMIERGEFRLDLYYRLHVIPLHVPSLRERKADITLLLNNRLDLLNKKYKTAKKLHYTTYETLIQYNWPGNVRELENLIERLILTTDDTIIFPDALPPSIVGQVPDRLKEKGNLIVEQTLIEDQDLKTILEKVENWVLNKARQECETTYEIASLLGISQPSVIRKLKKHNIIAPR